jgi:glycine cleavage system H protein
MNSDITEGQYYFTEQNEWLRLERNYALVGLTNLAKKELGLIESVEIHTVGKSLSENQVFGRIRTNRYLCKLIMPIRGKVLEANFTDYEKFNTIEGDFDPNEWIVKIAISLPLKSEKLYTLEEYKSENTLRAAHLIKYFVKVGG